MKSARLRHVFSAVLLCATALFAGTGSPRTALAQTAAPVAEPSTPDSKPKAAEPQVTPAPAAPAPATPASPPAPAPDSETKGAPGVPGIQDDATTQMLDIPSRPVAL